MNRMRSALGWTAREVDSAGTIMSWLRNEIGQPHPALGRGGPICPFVPPSIDANALSIVMESGVNDRTPREDIELLLVRHSQLFLEHAPLGSEHAMLRTALVVFPFLCPEGARILDAAHANLKTAFVLDGMMLGQFHPLCDSGAVHNPTFRNKTAPVPLVAIRHIALHDILFLHGRVDWFHKYQTLHGARYENAHAPDTFGYAAVYQRACARFDGATSDSAPVAVVSADGLAT